MEQKELFEKPERIIYRGGTLGAFQAMLEMVRQEPDVEKLMQMIEVAEEKNSRVRYIVDDDSQEVGHLLFCRPSDIDRSNSILLAPLAEGLKKGVLAVDYYHISPQYLSMLITPGYQNKVTQELILCAVLLPKQPVCLDDLNHILMEVGQPGLFDVTGDLQANRRNRALIGLVNYAQDHECPRDRWLTYAHEMLAYLKMDPLYRQGQTHSQSDLTDEDISLFESWTAKKDIMDEKTGYMGYRKVCFEDYRERKGMTVGEAQAKIGAAAIIGPESVKNLLCASRMSSRTRGSRETLVRMSIEMGCDLDEANRILMEAGYPLLYPFREDDNERRFIFYLLKNSLNKNK